MLCAALDYNLKNKSMFAEIVFPLPFRKSFTYSIPKEFENDATLGVRAVAPFGRRTLTGFIISVSNKTNVEEKIKPIYDILDDKPIFNENSLKFYKWISDYYLCSLGEALKLAVPYGTDIESKRRLIVNYEKTLELFRNEKDKKTIRSKILKVLIEKETINFSYLQKMVKKKNIYSIVRSLENDGSVTTLNQIEDPKVKIKTAKFVELLKPAAEVYEFIPEIESRSPKQVSILLELISKRNKKVKQSELLKKTKASQSSLQSLEEKGLIKVFEKEVERRFTEDYSEEHIEFILTKDQQVVLAEVEKFITCLPAGKTRKKFQSFLLHGVTGSGKTQVYIESIKIVLQQNQTALFLVPEISLTPQITTRLINNFGEKVTVLHSRMSLGERYDSWRKILSGKYKVVIGARSALFAPLKNIGIIIVDEEHDASYKQHDSVPKYNARDGAVVLASNRNCPVILGSATPSIESMYNAITGKYKLLNLPERIDSAILPEIELVNISNEKKRKRMENVFSKILLDKIEDRLKKKEGIIILQNRRGFSTQIYCEDCGEIETCENCSVSMVY
ncbi:MAG: primosomal protein N', partial [Ignavibacteriaceae bacterium]